MSYVNYKSYVNCVTYECCISYVNYMSYICRSYELSKLCKSQEFLWNA